MAFRPNERHSTPQGSSDRPPAPAPPIEPNEHPWLNAFGAAVPIYIILLIVFLPAQTGSSSYAAGELLWPAVLGALGAGGMARESEKVWHWWTYLVGVAGVVAFLLLLYAASQSM